MRSVSRIGRCGYLVYIITMFVCMTCMVSCGKKGVSGQETVAKTEIMVPYTEKQMLMISTSQRNAENKAYTDEIWGAKMDKQGHTYDEVFDVRMKEFFLRLYVMSMTAKSRGITLTDKENETVSKLSQEYIDAALKSGTKLNELTSDEVNMMFRDYALAMKLSKSVTGAKELEVSENEARIMDLECIVLDNKEQAERALFEVNAEGADFSEIARKKSIEKEIKVKAGHADLPKEVDEKVSLLSDSEISDIIEIGGKYYIYKCIKGYDEDATADRKELMEKSRRDEELNKIYDEYLKYNNVNLNMDEWNKFVNSKKTVFKEADFFSLYKKGFNNSK